MNKIQINIIERPVIIVISDPWEFGIECGNGPFPGKILAIPKHNQNTEDSFALIELTHGLRSLLSG